MQNKFNLQNFEGLIYASNEELNDDVIAMYQEIADEKRVLAKTRVLAKVYLAAKRAGIVSEALPTLQDQISDAAKEEWGSETATTYDEQKFEFIVSNEAKRRQQTLCWESLSDL